MNYLGYRDTANPFNSGRQEKTGMQYGDGWTKHELPKIQSMVFIHEIHIWPVSILKSLLAVYVRADTQVPNQLNDIHSQIVQKYRIGGLPYVPFPRPVTNSGLNGSSKLLAGGSLVLLWTMPNFCSSICRESKSFRSDPRFRGPCLYSGSQVVRISGIYWGFPSIRILRIPKCTGEIYMFTLNIMALMI